MICYVFIIDIYEGNTIFFAYLLFLSIGILSIQSVGHIIGILFSENVRIAIICSVGYGLFIFFLSNFLIPIQELHYTLQWLSNLSMTKLIFECMVILFYGFDRCTDRELSSIMYLLELEDYTFYTNARLLIFQFIFLRSLTLLTLSIKVNPFTSQKKVDKQHQIAYKKLISSNALIPGLSSPFELKIKF
jgi:hypothetical protein